MELFAATHATWPAARLWRLGPYTLRDGAGGGGRASAATLDGPFADTAPAIAAQREAGLRPLFMVRDGEDALDAALASQGLAAFNPTAILAAPAAKLAFRAADVLTIRSDAPLAIHDALWQAGGIGPGRRAVMARVDAPRLYLLGRLDDRPAGAAFVALVGKIAMLHALHVEPFARRRSLGARLSRDAAAWAAEHGATTFALAVARANAPAIGLYASLGLTEAAAYRYRIAPEEETP